MTIFCSQSRNPLYPHYLVPYFSGSSVDEVGFEATVLASRPKNQERFNAALIRMKVSNGVPGDFEEFTDVPGIMSVNWNTDRTVVKIRYNAEVHEALLYNVIDARKTS